MDIVDLLNRRPASSELKRWNSGRGPAQTSKNLVGISFGLDPTESGRDKSRERTKI